MLDGFSLTLIREYVAILKFNESILLTGNI